MEDRSTVVLGLGVGDADSATRCFFGVFDGHGGDAASSWCKQKMHLNLVKQPDFPADLPAAMRSALLQTDREFLTKFPKSSLDDGSTVIFAVLDLAHDRLIVANAGDSRGVLSRSGCADALSDDHKPDRPDERARVEAHGGMVQQASLFGKFMGPYRVYTRVRTGGLAVSRGLGDGLLKQNDLVIAEPELRDIHLAPGDEFMVLATDGVWDVFSNQQVVDFVRRHYLASLENPATAKDPSEVADMLVREAIQRGSLDNVTAIVVYFDNNAQFSGPPPSPSTTDQTPTPTDLRAISLTRSI
jgi:protein phosphatase 1L